MKFIKKFESFSSEISDEIAVGDMVYVDPYGPSTYGFSDGSGERRSDKPFKPKVYNFTPHIKYEVVFIKGDDVTLFDDTNSSKDMHINSVSKDKPFTDYVDPSRFKPKNTDVEYPNGYEYPLFTSGDGN